MEISSTGNRSGNNFRSPCTTYSASFSLSVWTIRAHFIHRATSGLCESATSERMLFSKSMLHLCSSSFNGILSMCSSSESAFSWVVPTHTHTQAHSDRLQMQAEINKVSLLACFVSFFLACSLAFLFFL